jgi:hypothetical protein
MRLSRRALRIGLPIVGVVLLVGAAAAVAIPSGLLSHASAPLGATASYTGKAGGTLSAVSTSKAIPKGLKPNLSFAQCAQSTDLQQPGVTCAPLGDAAAATTGGKTHFRSLKGHIAFNGGTKANTSSRPGAPKASGVQLLNAGSLQTSFNGLNDDDNHFLNGFHVTPPDQGLCVGSAGPFEAAGLPLGVSQGTTVVVEMDNDVWAIYTTSGTPLFKDTLVDLFSDPFASGDVGCQFDPATKAYFFTEIGGLLFGPDAGNFGTDLAVISYNGYAPYQVDTSVGATCFPDFPHQGYDPHAVAITINEFCGASQAFVGTNIYDISKSQLVALQVANFIVFSGISIGGVPALAMAPSFGDASNTMYLVNSFPYDQFGNSNSIAKTLGYWTIVGDQAITSGSGTVTLTGKVIGSETYAFPVPAASTGDGSVPSGSPSFVIKEPFLNPDDSRMEQLQLVNTSSGLRLFCALDTALTIGNDPSARDGAAWFDIDPSTGKVSRQGYLAAAGTYLLYPSIMRASTGTLVLDFSMTSSTMNPSTGYAVAASTSVPFGAIRTTGAGTGPHWSFSDILFNEARWGDYSAAALDPNGNVWVADEYIPPAPAGLDPIDNWGSEVWEVRG